MRTKQSVVIPSSLSLIIVDYKLIRFERYSAFEAAHLCVSATDEIIRKEVETPPGRRNIGRLYQPFGAAIDPVQDCPVIVICESW